ncbi:MAG TPA: hypothetical protein VIL85_10895 [Thermomicrobiales bacterium]
MPATTRLGMAYGNFGDSRDPGALDRARVPVRGQAQPDGDADRPDR